jgi:hypothetical protein
MSKNINKYSSSSTLCVSRSIILFCFLFFRSKDEINRIYIRFSYVFKHKCIIMEIIFYSKTMCTIVCNSGQFLKRKTPIEKTPFFSSYTPKYFILCGSFLFDVFLLNIEVKMRERQNEIRLCT